MQVRPRRAFSERNPVTIGVVVSAALVIGLLLALDIKHLPFLNGGRDFHAIFSESGGIESGDDVVISGLTVGTVSSVHLDHARVRIDFRVTDDGVRLGRRTAASITTETVLGKRGLKLVSAGPGALPEGATIPLARTTAPYDLTDALAGLTTTTSAIDTAAFANALRTITHTFQNTPASLQSTVRNVSRISATLASRDDELGTLLAASNNVSGILAQRDAQITTLLTDGAGLLGELDARRRTVSDLLVAATRLARQLDGLVADNEKTLGPALHELNQVVTLLNKNKKNVDDILDRAGPFAGSLGEAVSSGPFFQAYVQNLTRPLELSGLGGS